MFLIRYILIGLIVYLLVRAFLRFGEGEKPQEDRNEPGQKNNTSNKKVSKEIGEYIDYEDLD